MQPFTVSDAGKQLTGMYPEAASLQALAVALPADELSGFLRLWITEGIPSAFSHLPLLYEKIRQWMALRLHVDPKAITLVGSARLGYSLAPHPYFGRPFSANSDLDFNVVSKRLLDEMIADFQKWKVDFETKTINPPNEKARFYWTKNVEQLPRNIRSGFVDPYKVPSIPRYPTAAMLADIRWRVREKLSLTAMSRKISIRVFRDWEAFLSQARVNFVAAIRSRSKPGIQ